MNYNLVMERIEAILCSREDRIWMRCLARNLAMAGAMCAAFDAGWHQGASETEYGEGYPRHVDKWEPGCGRRMP